MTETFPETETLTPTTGETFPETEPGGVPDAGRKINFAQLRDALGVSRARLDRALRSPAGRCFAAAQRAKGLTLEAVKIGVLAHLVGAEHFNAARATLDPSNHR